MRVNSPIDKLGEGVGSEEEGVRESVIRGHTDTVSIVVYYWGKG